MYAEVNKQGGSMTPLAFGIMVAGLAIIFMLGTALGIVIGKQMERIEQRKGKTP
jgi:hypothetical protein